MNFEADYTNPEEISDAYVVQILIGIRAIFQNYDPLTTNSNDLAKYQSCLKQLQQVMQAGRGTEAVFEQAGYKPSEIERIKLFWGKYRPAAGIVKRIIACPKNTQLVWSYLELEDSLDAIHSVCFKNEDGTIIWHKNELTEAQATVKLLRTAQLLGIFEQ